MALAAVVLPTKAATYQSVMFKMSDPSERMCIHIEDDMTLKIVNSNIRMESSFGSIELPVNEVTSWTFSTEGGSSDEWAGIEEVTESTVDVTISAARAVIAKLPVGAHDAHYNG